MLHVSALAYLIHRMVLRLCDELDKAKELNDYFKKMLQDHIDKRVVPELQKKKDEVLLRDFVKEWKDYTILVHYMRKMFNYLVSLFFMMALGPLLPEKLLHADVGHERALVL